MIEYFNSARKYRPKVFDDIVGQDNIVKVLKDQVLKGRIANAYLFCGACGIGKTTMARVFAKAINCVNSCTNYGNPCLKCSFCLDDNFSVFELDAASNNSVEDIRRIIDQIRFPSFNNKFNIFIIDEVHMLSQAAFNSFLKTLEEPPEKVVFILATTEFNKVPATIVSRCQTFIFKPIQADVIVEELKKILVDKGIKFEDNALKIVAEKAKGGMRNALSILDALISFNKDFISVDVVKKCLNILDEEVFFEICLLILQKKKKDLILKYREIIEEGFEGFYFLDGLLSFFFNVFFAIDNVTVGFIESCKVKEYCEIARKFENPEVVENIIKLINERSLYYKESINKNFYIDILLLDIVNCVR